MKRWWSIVGCCALVAATILLAWPVLFAYWVSLATSWGSYPVVADWFDPLFAVLWLQVLLLYAALGFVCGLMISAPKPTRWWGVAVGAICGCTMLHLGRTWWSREHGATAVEYLWWYGVYAIPLAAVPMGYALSTIRRGAKGSRDAV